MTESHHRTVRTFNPGTFQSDQEIIEQFVVREHELAIVLEVIKGNVDADSCQHTLIVAPRGRGKTMLLARVAAELRTNAELSTRLLPIRFMEESHEIFSAADFWLDVLFYLSLETRTQHAELARNLQDTHADLTTRWRERELHERARAAVLEVAYRLGKRLVLMVENLQGLCANVDEHFGWHLRKTLQSEPQIILLASATSRFEGLDDAQDPFFELFRIIYLQSLDTEQCRRLWQAVSGDAVSARRIRALQILTGGDPRLLVMVAEFARHRSIRQLMAELTKLIDDHTEYFRGHLEAIGKTERRVYLALIDLWQPSTAGEIAARARMDIRPVSTMLGRLVHRGAVSVQPGAKQRIYSTAQPLYSIYYKLRRERDDAAVVQGLLQFMTVFYSDEEIGTMSGQLISDAARSAVIRVGVERARSSIPQLSRILSDTAWAELRQLAAYDKVVERFGSHREPRSLVRVASALVGKGHTQARLGEHATAIATYDEVIARVGSSDALDFQIYVAAALIHRGVAQHMIGAPSAATASYEQVVKHYGSSNSPELQVWVDRALVGDGIVQAAQGNHAAAIGLYDKVMARSRANDSSDVQALVAFALVSKAIVQEQSGEYVAAIATNDEVLRRFGSSDDSKLQHAVARALFNKSSQQRKRHQHAAAIATCDEVVICFGTSGLSGIQEMVAGALVNKGELQRVRGEYAAEAKTYDDVIERFGASAAPNLRLLVAQATYNKGFSQAQRRKHTAATASYDQLLDRFSVCEVPYVQELVAQALFNKAYIHGERGEHETEASIYDLVVERFGDSDSAELRKVCAGALINKGVAQTQRAKHTAAIASFNEVVERLGTVNCPDLRALVAHAMFLRSLTHYKIGEEARALSTCDELEAGFGCLLDNKGLTFKWNARWLRIIALIASGNKECIMDPFRSLYAAFVPSSDVMTSRMIGCVRILLSGGGLDSQIVDTLSSDPEKSVALAPLIVALRQRAGEEVRAPMEVLEVAADVRRQIDGRSNGAR